MSAIMQMMLGAPLAPAVFTATVSTSSNNVNLRSQAISAGWDGVRALSFVVNSGVIISSNNRTLPALTINGSFPNGVTLVNNGVIVGDGGDGGNGGSDTATNGTNGTAGGDAIEIFSAVSINNLGTIAGAGGGGGGGGLSLGGPPGGDDSVISFYGGCGGGGGASGSFSSNGGGGGTGTFPGNSGASGSYNSAGLGGTKASHASGGNGGSWGAAGSNGGAGSYTAGSGGAGGRSINGNSFVTWVAFGTRLGAII